MITGEEMFSPPFDRTKNSDVSERVSQRTRDGGAEIGITFGQPLSQNTIRLQAPLSGRIELFGIEQAGTRGLDRRWRVDENHIKFLIGTFQKPTTIVDYDV